MAFGKGKKKAAAAVEDAIAKDAGLESNDSKEAGLAPHVSSAKVAKVAKDYSSHPKFSKFKKEE